MEWTSGYMCINTISTCIYTNTNVYYTQHYTRVHIACLRGIVYIYTFFVHFLYTTVLLYVYSINNNLYVVLHLSSVCGKKIKHIYAGQVSKELLQREYVVRTARFVLHHHSIVFKQFYNQTTAMRTLKYARLYHTTRITAVLKYIYIAI